jgi:hypothetical protein
MPSIGPAVQSLVRDAKLTLNDVQTLRSDVAAGRASVKDVEALATKFVDAFDAGVGSAVQKLLGDLRGVVRFEGQIANLGSAPGLLNNTVQLPRDAAVQKPSVLALQKGLMALASRTNDPALMMPTWGADGGWGAETTSAVKAFQTKYGVGLDANQQASGVVDVATAKKLDELLRGTNIPAIFVGGVDPPSGPSRQTIVKAAQELIDKHGNNYAVANAWIPIDDRHAMITTFGRRVNTEAPSTKGNWKCNLFACSVLAAAGWEPPFLNNGTKGEYPNANLLYTFADKYQPSKHKQRFELRGEALKLNEMSTGERELAIKEALKNAQPGDLIIVDHLGAATADGGHCRVMMEALPDGSYKFAQAGLNSAENRTETWSALMNEEALGVLRPTVKRPEGPAKVG